MVAKRKKTAKKKGKAAKAKIADKRQSGRNSQGLESRSGADSGELLDMREAIEMLKTTRPTFYRWLRSGKIKGMKVGRQWRFYREEIERFLKGQEPKIALPADIKPLIEQLSQRYQKLTGKAFKPEDDDSVKTVINLMIDLAVRMRASDIHIEPRATGSGAALVALRLRIDGVLHGIAEFDIRLLPAIVEQWKIMASLDVHERQLPQDGRIMLPDETVDLRVCFLPAYLGEAVTVRLLPREQVTLSLDSIDYSPADRYKLLSALASPNGVIVINGPTGSGKTTVLYCALNHLISPEVKVMSVEDPVEYLIPGTVQLQVNPKMGLTFSNAMRSIMRSSPDVIMVGEIRNQETLSLCCQAALVGHLVMTVLHATDSVNAFRRMVDLDVPAFLITDAVSLISSQRLIRKLCPDCSVETRPPKDSLAKAKELAANGGLEWDKLEKGFRKPVGCSKCGQTGYRGKTIICEMLEVQGEVAAAMRKAVSVDELRTIAVREGMTTKAADGVRRAAAGETTLDEVMWVLALK